MEGIARGEPLTLLGYPVRIAEPLAGAIANVHPVLFGIIERLRSLRFGRLARERL